MKLIQRRAYGFRNFENYRLRVKALCGQVDMLGTIRFRDCPCFWCSPEKRHFP